MSLNFCGFVFLYGCLFHEDFQFYLIEKSWKLWKSKKKCRNYFSKIADGISRDWMILMISNLETVFNNFLSSWWTEHNWQEGNQKEKKNFWVFFYLCIVLKFFLNFRRSQEGLFANLKLFVRFIFRSSCLAYIFTTAILTNI